jgi:hypothetical protein
MDSLVDGLENPSCIRLQHAMLNGGASACYPKLPHGAGSTIRTRKQANLHKILCKMHRSATLDFGSDNARPPHKPDLEKSAASKQP